MPHPGETVLAGPMTGAAERRTKRAGLTAHVLPWLSRPRLAPASACKLLDEAEAGYGARPGRQLPGCSQTCRAIGTHVDRPAAGPQPLGGRKDAKGGLFLPHCQTFAVRYLALLKARGAVSECDPRRAREVLTLEDCGSETRFMLTVGQVAPFGSIALRRPLGARTPLSRCRQRFSPATLHRTTIGQLSSKELNAEEEARRERK